MSNWKLQLYHQMPRPLRTTMASIRGLQLRRWRYGPETERLVEEALERDYWSLEQWRTYQENRLAYILERAATRVPYYREQWITRRRRGDNASWSYLENWPILEKESIRQNPLGFVADDHNIQRMFHEHTSGTTGKPLSLWWSKPVTRQWYALFEARWRRWYGVNQYTRWAILGGQLVTPTKQRIPPFWVWNRAFNQLYMSSYHIASDTINLYLDAINRYEIEYIYCYTSSAYAIAVEAIEKRLLAKQLRVVITNAEPVFDYQRKAISRVFQCPVRETYGMSEIIVGASECEHGNLHLWPEVGFIEVEQDEISLDDDQTGNLIGTSLLNDAMPLIRYRVGDRITLSNSQSMCLCGRFLPQIKRIEGRSDDILYTRNGRSIGRLDPIFKTNLPIQEAQIVQESFDLIRVRYVPTKDFSLEDQHSIATRLRERMGDIQIEFEALDKIPRTSNGKFRAVICNLPLDERRKVK